MGDTWTVDCLPGYGPAVAESPKVSSSRSEPEEIQRLPIEREDRVRRFESANTDRLNVAHWQHATEQHINLDLASDLPTLWARCIYEAANNPLIEGVIETHITDTIGENGPTCQIEPRMPGQDSVAWSKYTEEAENLIDEISEAGWDMHGEYPLPDLLAIWMWSEWTLGDILGQEVSIRDQSVSVRINPIDPRRLQAPWANSNPSIALGVERNPDGRRTRYWFTEPRDTWYSWNAEVRSIDARFIYHEYRRREIGQVRGVPLLAGGLQVLADLRDFDQQTLDAARSAADFAAVAYSDHPDAEFVQCQESVPIRRRRITHMPPGWKIAQLAPTHPSTQYIDFRRERLRELGRAVAMPLMTILLDASEHNYSSARMDGQNYQRALRRVQKRLERKILNRYTYAVLMEAELRGVIRRRPGQIRANWLWDPVPHVDPSKEAKADETMMRNYQLDPYTAASRANRDFEQIARRWARANALLSSLGLPPVGASVSSPPTPDVLTIGAENANQGSTN